MRCKRLVSLLLALMLLLPAVSLAEESAPGWTVGFSAQAILPDEEKIAAGEYYIAGYNSGMAVTGVLDPQYARAVYLDDGSGNGGVMMVAIDCVGLSSVDVDVIRSRLTDFMKDTGCQFIHVCSTHTHAGIDTMGLWGPLAESGINESFMQTLYASAEQAVRDAYENRKPGRLYYGSAELPEALLRDSREPIVTDPTLTCLRFAPEDGSKGLRIYHFPAHPEALRSQNSLVSADYPAVLGRLVQEATGDDYAYFTGAIGGLIMTRELDANLYTSLEKTGKMLADAALSIDNEEELEPSIVHFTQEVYVPLENTTFALMQFLGVLRSRAVPSGSGTGLSIVSRMSYIRLGSLPIILVPGELFPELASGVPSTFTGANEELENPKSFTEILGTDRYLIFGLADDEIGYIVTPSDFILHKQAPYLENAYDSRNRRHYEETNSAGPMTAHYLANALEKLIDKVNEQE